MKKALKVIMLAAMVFGATTLFAQPQRGHNGQNRTPEERAQAVAERLKTELSLSDKQQKEVYNNLLEQHKNREEIANKNEAEQTKAYEEAKVALMKKMERTLDAKQFQALKEKYPNFGERRGGGMGGNHGDVKGNGDGKHKKANSKDNNKGKGKGKHQNCDCNGNGNHKRHSN